MLTCITCSKQRVEDGEEAPSRGTPNNTKDAVKSLTTQMKDMAMKVSKCSKQADSNFKIGQRAYPEFDTTSDRVVPYPYASSSSTPARDFTRFHSRFSTASVDDQNTTGRRESITGDVMLESEDGPKEWVAQVEPGVQITFLSLPTGGNDLKRIRFSREMFDKWQAQRWWGENFDRLMELYNVRKFNQQVMNTPGRSEDGRDSVYSRLGCPLESPRMTSCTNKEWTPRYSSQGGNGYNNYYNGGGSSAYMSTSGYPRGDMDPSRPTTSSRDEGSVSISNASEIDSEWIEEDEPGVYITIRQLVDGTRELRRVRFSRERFGEVNAKNWWETNRDRIQAQYLC